MKGTLDRNAGVGAAVLNGMVREGLMEKVSILRRQGRNHSVSRGRVSIQHEQPSSKCIRSLLEMFEDQQRAW